MFASKQNEVISNEFDVQLVQVKSSGENILLNEDEASEK